MPSESQKVPTANQDTCNVYIWQKVRKHVDDDDNSDNGGALVRMVMIPETGGGEQGEEGGGRGLLAQSCPAPS